MSPLLLLLAGPAVAHEAASTPAERFESADLVVVAEVTGLEVRPTVDADVGIETEVWLAPLEVLRGQVPDPLAVVLPGGALDGVRVVVEDVPTLEVDRRYLLFLARAGEGWGVLGGEAGALRVRGAGSTGPTLDQVLGDLGLEEVRP